MGLAAAIDITSGQHKTILVLLNRFLPNTTTWVYGSRVNWTSRPQSDLDMVVFSIPEQKLQVSNLKEAFEESDLPFRVDLFIWDEVPEQFRKNIEVEHVVLREKREQAMASELFPLVPLGEVTQNFDSIRIPVKKADRKPGSYPYYGASGIVDYVDSYIFDGDYLLLAEDGENLKTHNTPIAFMANGRFWVNNHAHILLGNTQSITRFLCYALQIADVKSYLSGSTRPKLTQRDMNRIPVYCPPLAEQKAIAHILGTLDDKIELNRKMNETLEAMAQAMFKSWFVDFDPVIDNALAAGNPIPDELAERAARRKSLGDARKPLPEDIRRLFPDSFKPSELGPIPNGWRVGTVGDLGEVICGKTPPTKDESNYGREIPLITIPDMHGMTYVAKTGKALSRKGANTQNKKFLPKNTICVSCIATPGLVVLTSEVSQTNQQINSVLPNNWISSFFCYGLLSLLGGQIHAGGSGGSVFANLSKGRFLALKVVLCTLPLHEAFDRLVEHLFTKLLENQHQIHTLSILRDTLLPRLLSGELRIPYAEKFLGNVV